MWTGEPIRVCLAFKAKLTPYPGASLFFVFVLLFFPCLSLICLLSTFLRRQQAVGKGLTQAEAQTDPAATMTLRSPSP